MDDVLTQESPTSGTEQQPAEGQPDNETDLNTGATSTEEVTQEEIDWSTASLESAVGVTTSLMDQPSAQVFAVASMQDQDLVNQQFVDQNQGNYTLADRQEMQIELTRQGISSSYQHTRAVEISARASIQDAVSIDYWGVTVSTQTLPSELAQFHATALEGLHNIVSHTDFNDTDFVSHRGLGDVNITVSQMDPSTQECVLNDKRRSDQMVELALNTTNFNEEDVTLETTLVA